MSDHCMAPLRTVLLADDDGMLQVILATHDLLDLQQLEQATGRTLTPPARQDILRAHRQHKLASIADSRHCLALPTLIDHHLLDHGDCCIEPDGVSLDQICRALKEAGLTVQHLECSVSGTELHHQLPDPTLDLAQIHNSVKQFTTRRIRQRLDDTLEIPPLSPTAERILQLRSNPHATADELTAIVESDPSLAAQVVSWASSPYYAAPGRVSSVRDAIVRVMGFELVSNLTLGLILGKAIAIPADRRTGILPYWAQAAYCSLAVEALARLMPPGQRPRQGLLYLTGLLHNFGYLVLAHTFPPHFEIICRYTEANPTISHIALEQHLIGISREQIGAWLLHTWRMPDELVTALRHQHDAEYAGPHAVYANLIYMALRLLHKHDIGSAPATPIPPEMFQRHGLDAAQCREVVAQLVQSDDAARVAEQINA